MILDLTDIDIVLAEIRAMQAAFTRLEAAVETLCERAVQDQSFVLPPCDVPVTEHRREHRMGPAPKIATDPEMQAFILARLDRLTYDQIADEIARHFPPSRRVHRATVPRWVQRWRKER